jgi:hypothetical protein
MSSGSTFLPPVNARAEPSARNKEQPVSSVAAVTMGADERLRKHNGLLHRHAADRVFAIRTPVA